MNVLTEDELQEIERRMYGVGVDAGVVDELVSEVRRLREGILAHKHDEDRWQGLATDKADDRLWALIDDSR